MKTVEQFEAQFTALAELRKPFPSNQISKLVRGKGSRQWNLSEEEMVKKLTGMGIPKSAVYVSKLVSPAQAEKLTWEKAGVPTSLSDRQKKSMNAEYVSTASGKPVVAPESDPREAIVLDAAPMFGAIDVQAEAVVPAVPAFLQVPAWLQVPRS